MSDSDEREELPDGAAIIEAAYGLSGKKHNRLADASLVIALIGLALLLLPILILYFGGAFALMAAAVLAEELFTWAEGVLLIVTFIVSAAMCVTGFALGIAGAKRAKSMGGKGKSESVFGIVACCIEIIVIVLAIVLFCLYL